jgi:hypothetical protein
MGPWILENTGSSQVGNAADTWEEPMLGSSRNAASRTAVTPRATNPQCLLRNRNIGVLLDAQSGSTGKQYTVLNLANPHWSTTHQTM